MTLYHRDGKAGTYLESLTRDNVGSSERVIAPMLRKEVLPVARKLFRTTQYPSGLTPIELKFLKRLEWPKGMYMYSEFKLAVDYYTQVQKGEAPSGELHDSYTSTWVPSSVYEIDLNSGRNLRSGSKGAGFPFMGKKREQWTEALVYVNEKIKPNPTLENCWSILPGFRAQKPTEPGTKPVVRMVFGTPVSHWLMECEAFDDAINKTVASSQSLNADIQTFYCEASDLKKWINGKFPEVTEWVSLDMTRFDTTISAEQIGALVDFFTPEWEFSELMKDYLAHALVIMPDYEVSRDGGMPSGSKLTNLGEGKLNTEVAYDVLKRMGLDRFLVCMLVNGDDIVLGLSTKLTKDNLEKFSTYTPFNLNVDKCDQGDYVWSSSLYSNGDILTASLFKTLNNMMFTERQKSSISGSKEYIELSISQQCKNIEEHPNGPTIIKIIAQNSRSHINQMSDEQMFEAAEFIASNSYRYDYPEASNIIQEARHSLYAEMGS